MPYAWHPIGHPLELPQSSPKQRLNVVGFLQRDTTLVPYLLDRSVETAAGGVYGSVQCAAEQQSLCAER